MRKVALIGIGVSVVLTILAIFFGLPPAVAGVHALPFCMLLIIDISRKKPHHTSTKNNNNEDHRNEIARLGVRVYDLSNLESGSMLRHGTYAEAPQIVGMIGAQLAEPKFEDRQASGFVDEEAVKAAKAPPPGQAPITTEALAPPKN